MPARGLSRSPRSSLPGFPHWIYLDRPQANEGYFVELVREAVEVPSAATEALGRAAREAGAYVVIGVNERSRGAPASCSTPISSSPPDGVLLGWHRKLMPTYAEKMIWSFGDGSDVARVRDADRSLGTLCCGENTIPWPASPSSLRGSRSTWRTTRPAQPETPSTSAHNIQIRSAAHAFEGNCFVVAAGSLISDEMRERLGDTAEKRKPLGNGSQTFTAILGPDGKVIAGPAADDTEAIVYGSIDLDSIIRQKIHHDVAGNYNRFDVLSLRTEPDSPNGDQGAAPGGGGCRRPGSRGEGPGGRAEGAPGLGLARGAESACRVAAGRAGRLALGGALAGLDPPPARA